MHSPDADRSRSPGATLEAFFDEIAPLEPGDRLIVAFSGGPDSTALLSLAMDLGRRRDVQVIAAHLDHGLDVGSGRRAAHAAELAAQIGAPFVTERLAPGDRGTGDGVPGGGGRGLEDWARTRRYEFLERVREAREARWIATAHHREDQIETVLLRVLLGSGLEGLGAIDPRRDPVVRPLLTTFRADLVAEIARRGLEPIADPTNRDPRPRSMVRYHLAPRLLGGSTEAGDVIVRVAAQARRLSASLAPRLTRRLDLRAVPDPRARADAPDAGLQSVDLTRLRGVSPTIRSFALALLHRRSGLPYPAGGAARRELERQLAAGGAIGADCGGGARWESLPPNGPPERLALRRQVEAPTPPFTYTLRVPGTVVLPGLDLCMSVAWEPLGDWVFQGRPRRAALALPVNDGDRLTVRNRRPGDRIQPLGCGYQKRLKEVLIDAGVPREQRDRLPLLCLGNQIAWIPGLTIDENYRIKDQTHAWIARIEPIAPPEGGECRPASARSPG